VSVASAQIADQVIVFGKGHSVLRFDRRLDLLGETVLPGFGTVDSTSRLSIDGQGVAWIPFYLQPAGIERMQADGSLFSPAPVPDNLVSCACSADGDAFALTMGAPWGHVSGFGHDGQFLWTNSQGIMPYAGAPTRLLITTQGHVWIGGVATPPGKFWYRTLLTEVSTENGGVERTYWPPDLTRGFGDEVLPEFVATIDGTMWMHRYGPASVTPFGAMENTDGTTILQSFNVDQGQNGQTAAVRVDGAGQLFMVSKGDVIDKGGNKLLRVDPASPDSPAATYVMGGLITGHALGASGDEAFAMVAPFAAPLTRRLERVNLVTGRKSSIPTDTWYDATLAYGDPTGFVFANTVDRQGDNDGDGIPNGVETAAHSNPFDALSRPDGPKVFIDFVPGSNAPVLILRDPDGLLDERKGLDLAKLSLKVGGYGEVFPNLLPFVTAVDFSPDRTQARVVFGALHLADNAQLKFEARVTDLTGAVGWDFQVSPPGDL
jgi:hypothetical protein